MITAEQRKIIRHSILRYALGNIGLPLAVAYLKAEGWPGVDAEFVKAEIAYLADPDKGLLRRVNSDVSPEVAIWTITAKGRDYLAENA